MFNTVKIAKSLYDDRTEVINLQDNLKVTLHKGVFIPDRVTPSFINVALKCISNYKRRIDTIADVGTGSGIIAISIARRFPHKKVYAYDISTRALKLAAHNVATNKINNISLFRNKTNIWIDSSLREKIDFIVSNPPYIGDLEYFSKIFPSDYPDAKYQPIRAIRSYDKYGLRPYVDIFHEAKRHKVKYVLFRCNTGSIDKVRKALSESEDILVKKTKSKISGHAFLFIERIC